MGRVLLLGGLDPTGGAGITADATVVALHHAQPLPIAVVLTDQNRTGCQRLHVVPAAQWCRTLRTVLDDGEVHAIKVGMIADPVSVRAIARELAPLRSRVPIVVDPVLAASAGGFVASPELVQAYVDLLLPITTVLTPNVPELAALCAGDPKRGLHAGAQAILAKGGHEGGATSDDVLWQGAERVVFRRERLPCGPVRGTGCALAAAIASRLARRTTVAEACRNAGDWLAALLRILGPAAADGPPRTLPFGRVLPVLDPLR